MTTKPRPWFRFHLSTGVVLMIVAGALLYANMRERWNGYNIYNQPALGWPWVYTYDKIINWEHAPPEIPFAVKQTDYWLLVLNVGTGVVILAGVGAGLEWLIRRREAHKP